MALQAADVALLSEDMSRLADAHRLARRTAAVIRQNPSSPSAPCWCSWRAACSFALSLPLAVVGHEGGTVLVVLNGLRLLSDPIRRPARGGARTRRASRLAPQHVVEAMKRLALPAKSALGTGALLERRLEGPVGLRATGRPLDHRMVAGEHRPVRPEDVEAGQHDAADVCALQPGW